MVFLADEDRLTGFGIAAGRAHLMGVARAAASRTFAALAAARAQDRKNGPRERLAASAA